MAENDDLHNALSERYERVVRSIADDLRRAADGIERRPVPESLRDLLPSHLSHAARVLHDLNSLQGNLATDSLVQAAAEVDIHIRNRER